MEGASLAPPPTSTPAPPGPRGWQQGPSALLPGHPTPTPTPLPSGSPEGPAAAGVEPGAGAGAAGQRPPAGAAETAGDRPIRRRLRAAPPARPAALDPKPDSRIRRAAGRAGGGAGPPPGLTLLAPCPRPHGDPTAPPSGTRASLPGLTLGCSSFGGVAVGPGNWGGQGMERLKPAGPTALLVVGFLSSGGWARERAGPTGVGVRSGLFLPPGAPDPEMMVQGAQPPAQQGLCLKTSQVVSGRLGPSCVTNSYHPFTTAGKTEGRWHSLAKSRPLPGSHSPSELLNRLGLICAPPFVPRCHSLILIHSNAPGPYSMPGCVRCCEDTAEPVPGPHRTSHSKEKDQ